MSGCGINVHPSNMPNVVDLLEDEVAKLRAENERMRGWIRMHSMRDRDRDHACSQCYPFGPILIPGFVCGYHVAVAVPSNGEGGGGT